MIALNKVQFSELYLEKYYIVVTEEEGSGIVSEVCKSTGAQIIEYMADRYAEYIEEEDLDVFHKFKDGRQFAKFVDMEAEGDDGDYISFYEL